jgi:hypothetical protein
MKTMIKSNEVTKYATLRVKPETQDRVNRYIADRMVERRGKRITVDEVIVEAFEALDAARKAERAITPEFDMTPAHEVPQREAEKKRQVDAMLKTVESDQK